MNAKEILLKQMAACHDDESWFVPMRKALTDLTAEQAGWRDGSTNNSIWQTVNHLLFWNDRYLLRFNDLEIPKFEGNNDSTFEGDKENPSQEDWNSTIEKLDALLLKWSTDLTKADEEKLSSKYNNSTWYSILADINIHNAYHIGQIIHTRKLQGSWKPTVQQI